MTEEQRKEEQRKVENRVKRWNESVKKVQEMVKNWKKVTSPYERKRLEERRSP
jgi:Cys-tRNA synthase (O-phospho-L-seryl-tRNA:Cys-tRNA synthase)